MKRFFIFLLALLVTVPAITLAQDNFLVGIPGVEQGENTNFDDYIQAVYVMFISIAALLAVVKIIIAGVKYMFTDIVTQKGEAKKDIQGAVFGLLIVLSAVLILTVINPELTRFNFEQEGVRLPEALPDPNQIQGNLTENSAFECSEEGTEVVVVSGQQSCQPIESIENATTISSQNDDVNFLFTPINNQTFIDARERSGELRDYELNQIEGVISVPGTLDGGLTDFDTMEFESIRPACEGVTGTDYRLIRVRNASIDGFTYYCINVN